MWALIDLADIETDLNDFAAGDRDLREALPMARAIDFAEGVAICIGNLSDIALDQERWSDAEALAREAIPLSADIGRQELIASDCRRLAEALWRQGKAGPESCALAQRAVDIFTRLNTRPRTRAETLQECGAASVRDAELR